MNDMNDQHFDDVACCEYLDGSLPKSELAAFERHLRECGACRAMIEEASQAQDGLRHLRLRPGPDLSPRIMAAVRRLPVPVPEAPNAAPGNRRLVGWLSLLASAAVVVILLVSIPRTVPHGAARDASPVITRTALPAQAVSSQRDELFFRIVTAEGSWNSSPQPVDGIFREATTFTTGSNGHLALEAGSDGRIEMFPGSRVHIDGEKILIETGAVRCALKPRRSGPSWALRSGAMHAAIVSASFGARVASTTSTIELFEGKMTLAATESAAPILLTAGSRAVYDDQISLELLGESVMRAWDIATSVARVQAASQAAVPEMPHPVPEPATQTAGAAHPTQPASTTASPAIVSDDPISTLLNH